jgi:outer membrane protein assembly factor BamB
MQNNSTLWYLLALLLICVSACHHTDSYGISSPTKAEADATVTVTQSAELSLAWSTDLSTPTGGIWAALIQDGALYYATAESTVAYDLTEQEDVWVSPGGSTSILLAGETVLVTFESRNSELIARDKSSGTEVWRISVSPNCGPVPKGIAIGGDLVFIGCRHSINAVAIDSGETIWKHNMPSQYIVVSGEYPVVMDPTDGYALMFNRGTLYVHLAGPSQPTQSENGIPSLVSSEMALLAIDAASGEELWRFPYNLTYSTEGAPIHNLVFYQDWVILVKGTDLIIVGKNTGRVFQQIDNRINGLEASPAIQDKHLVMAQFRGLITFDIESGKKLWEVTGFRPVSKPVLSGNAAFLVIAARPADYSKVTAVDLRTGAIISESKSVLKWTPYVLEMAVNSEAVYVVTPTHIHQFEFGSKRP